MPWKTIKFNLFIFIDGCWLLSMLWMESLSVKRRLQKPWMAFLICPNSLVDSLWPSGTIRRQGTESTLAHVMACCLMAPSRYLNQCWLIISRSCVIHLRALSWVDLKTPLSKTKLKITFLESHSDLPGANELRCTCRVCPMKYAHCFVVLCCGYIISS